MNDEAEIKCPFYLSKKRKKLQQAITVTCEQIENNLGFDVKNMLAFRSIKERTDWMELFCEDRFTSCPYYQKIYKKYEETDGKRAEKRNRDLKKAVGIFKEECEGMEGKRASSGSKGRNSLQNHLDHYSNAGRTNRSPGKDGNKEV